MKKRAARYGALALVLLCGAFLFFPQKVRYGWENVMLLVDRSSERAFNYGELHFDATYPASYDIERAAAMLTLAQERGGEELYLYHELARIAFLKGDFEEALALINTQIEKRGDETPNSYYVRGLIEGYMGAYDEAARDYEHYVAVDPYNWAALNDYAWILLRAGRSEDALRALERSPIDLSLENPWLLNTYAIALYETGSLSKAYEVARHAYASSQEITPAQWLRAYPGNDPAIAGEGIAALQKAASDNMHRIGSELPEGEVQ